ncbi:MAG: hypothetical protein DRH12_06695 [Deltaproteobacteria bacterium]|nr:MAG: hypothetical protein DRH12_06695 [Deltaproteobacteria bacterium]
MHPGFLSSNTTSRVMGAIFTRDMQECYCKWQRSRQGRAVEAALERLIVSLMDLQPGLRVLDIGCGSGNHLLLLNRLGLDVSGVDASPYMIQEARERLGHRCDLRTCNAEDLPFDDNEFDMVFMINTLEFVKDPLQVLREAGRVASRQVFIGAFNSLSWTNITNRIQGLLGNPMFRNMQSFTLWDLKALVKRAFGEVPVSWQCVCLYPQLLDKAGVVSQAWWKGQMLPFGNFLALRATMFYTVRAHTIPLKVKMEDASQPLLRHG